MPTIAQYIKDPSAILDWGFNWNVEEDEKLPWLASGETITEHVITVDEGITLDSSIENNGFVKVWLSGGELGQIYHVSCKITTNGGRTDERTILIKVLDR